MPKKSQPVDIDQLRLLVGPMGQPIKMAAETLEVSEYKIRKTIADNNIDKCEESYVSVIIDRAFSQRLSEKEFVKQRALASKLFKVAPDIRFWKSFNFEKYQDKYTCLTYFLTGFLKTLKYQYEAFQKNVEDKGSQEGSVVIASKLFPNRDFTQSNHAAMLADADLMFKECPDVKFWQGFNLLEAFPDYQLGSLRYFHTEYAKKIIRGYYNRYTFTPEQRERVELEENKIEGDVVVKPRIRTVIDFLNS